MIGMWEAYQRYGTWEAVEPRAVSPHVQLSPMPCNEIGTLHAQSYIRYIVLRIMQSD